MSEAIAIRLGGVGLRYRLARHKPPSLKEYAIHWVKGALSYEHLWALSDIDLEVPRGEMLGIIGRNGAGKSTLLKVISRVLPATRGSVQVYGTVAPILELGTGFDHELSGRENILLNALLLGHRRRDIEAAHDEIVDFSELGDFIDSPIRNYSSGMLARLGFSIATAWVPEVLILDEVLTVGDAAFTAKCERRLDRFRARGTTILLVSHSHRDIAANCTRCLWLDAGCVRGQGEAKAVLALYEEAAESGRTVGPAAPEPEGAEAVEATHVEETAAGVAP